MNPATAAAVASARETFFMALSFRTQLCCEKDDGYV
jgi:hypothetical protein